jgi:predicted molibdopterin-dependent oxidoreductase YjgC
MVIFPVSEIMGNQEHINQLASLWNVDPGIIPHWAPPTHAMQIWRYAEQGLIKFLWISGTNPAVSMPDLERIRKILQKEDLFVIVQDAFLNETSNYADVVLPAALWGEKTGTFTNITARCTFLIRLLILPAKQNRTMKYFLIIQTGWAFKDKDGNPLIKWKTPEEIFEAWKECTRGRPCDYTGMSYAKLSEGSGIQWPCNEQFPDGAVHIYTDGKFNTGYRLLRNVWP